MFRVVHCTQVQTLCIADTRLTFNKWLVTNPLALIPYLIPAKLLHPQLFLEQVLFWLKQPPKTDWCLDFVSGNLGNHYPVMVLEYQRNGISYASFYIGILYYILIPCALHANQDGTFNRASKMQATSPHCSSHHLEEIRGFTMFRVQILNPKSVSNIVWSSNLPDITGQNRSVLVALSVFWCCQSSYFGLQPKIQFLILFNFEI